jgi:hypothetical protein
VAWELTLSLVAIYAVYLKMRGRFTTLARRGRKAPRQRLKLGRRSVFVSSALPEGNPVMLKNLVVTIAFLGLTSAAHAANYNWRSTTSLINGNERNCGDAPYGDNQLEVSGNTLKIIPDRAHLFTYTIDLTTLQPDGSGRIDRVSKKNQVNWHYDFAPGTGPRNITVSNNITVCQFLYTPK